MAKFKTQSPKRRHKLPVLVLLFIFGLTLMFGRAASTSAQSLSLGDKLLNVAQTSPPCSCSSSSTSVNLCSLPGSCTDLSNPSNSAAAIKTALNILFSILGAIALLIVTIAGFRYVISRGEPQEVSKAKDTILYALIGLVVCMAALAIVNFVAGNV
ncbi:MAG TPA: pilin [Candidatus Saccharimonadales bacterium]|nr:pilin [Candidatus Saccharimonadales bacterium]